MLLSFSSESLANIFHINNCGTYTVNICVSTVSYVIHMHAYMYTHTHVQHPFHAGEESRLLQNGTSVYSERFKDNLPGLEEPSVPAIPDCFGGVSINTEQAAWQAVQWKGSERFALKQGLMPLFKSITAGCTLVTRHDLCLSVVFGN